MKNSKLRRALLLAACAVMLVCLSVGATLAYLTAVTDPVNNTFTYGNVSIDLDEGNVYDPVGEKDEFTAENNGTFVDQENDRVKANLYKLVPGRTYDKDPTVHIASTSETAYVFVKVENNFEPYEKTGDTNCPTIAEQMAKWGWVAIAEGSNIYCLCETTKDADGNDVVTPKVVDPATDPDLVVFEEFTLSDTLSDTEFEEAAKVNISITAYAIQSEGIDATTGADIWALYQGQVETNAGTTDDSSAEEGTV